MHNFFFKPQSELSLFSYSCKVISDDTQCTPPPLNKTACFYHSLFADGKNNQNKRRDIHYSVMVSKRRKLINGRKKLDYGCVHNEPSFLLEPDSQANQPVSRPARPPNFKKVIVFVKTYFSKYT